MHFNSRPSARGDPRKIKKGEYDFISIHAPPRGATRLKSGSCFMRGISIHAPPRGATKRAGAVIHAWRDFNSRPSARGDLIVCDDVVNLNISIHAPPRGATQRTHTLGLVNLISIHAPPRGATSVTASRLPTELYFNSRPSARGDLIRKRTF